MINVNFIYFYCIKNMEYNRTAPKLAPDPASNANTAAIAITPALLFSPYLYTVIYSTILHSICSLMNMPVRENKTYA